MVERKNMNVFDEALILNQLLEDIAQGKVRNFTSSPVQKKRQIQENIYQSARQKIIIILNKIKKPWNRFLEYGAQL